MGDCRFCKHWSTTKRESDRHAECVLVEDTQKSKVWVMGYDCGIETEFDFGCHQFEIYLPPLPNKAKSESSNSPH